MKLYISHASSFDYVNELYKPLIESEISKDHELFLPHEGENMAVHATDIMDTFDLMICEVSYPSTGQGIVMGLAISAQVPLVCFYREGTKPSSVIGTYCEELISYTTDEDLIEQIATRTASPQV